MTAGPRDGWYPDPSGHAQLRYWSGHAWTEWVVQRGQVLADPLPGWRRKLAPADVSHLTFIDEVFLPEATSRGLLDEEAAGRLYDLSARMTAEALAGPVTADMAIAAPPVERPEGRGAPAAEGPEQAPVRPEPRVREPGPLRQWWRRSRQSIGADLAVHGLAYLGVLLLFVGAFGLVAFAFGGVQPSLRPVAEVTIAAVPFLTAALLLRRGAEIVGRSLELAGGLLLPVMVMTVFLDDVPPDLDGGPMVVVMTLALLGLGVGYGLWSGRHPDSALRYVAAPLVWLAAGVATMGVGRELPAGAAVASVTAAQVAAMTVVLTLTLVAARAWARHALAAPTRAAAIPGMVVLAVMAVLTWIAESWPAVAVLVTGVALLAAIELVADRLPSVLVALAQPAWWAVTSLALVSGLDVGPAGLVATLGFVGLLELTAARRPLGLALALNAAGAVLALTVTAGQPWYGLAVIVAAVLWLGWRRLRPYAVPRAASTLDVATAVLPFAGLLWVGLATESIAVPLVVGSVLVLLAALAAARRLLVRGSTDRLWTRTWAVTAPLVSLGVLGVWQLEVLSARWGGGVLSAGEAWLLPVSAATLTVAAVVGPTPTMLRGWTVVGLGTLTLLVTAAQAQWSVQATAVVLAVAALAVVVGAQALWMRVERDAAASYVLAAHAVGLGAVLLAVSGPAAVAAAGLLTTGFVVTTAADAVDASPVSAALGRADPTLRFVPPAAVAVGLPGTAALALDAADLGAWWQSWPLTLLLVTTAALYVALAWLPLPHRPRAVAVLAASLAAVAAAVSAPDRATAIVGLAAVVLTAALLPAARRPAAMVWFAWASLAPLVGLSVAAVWPAFAGMAEADAVAVSLVGVGAVLLIGGLLVDRGGGSDAPQWRVGSGAALPAVVLGAGEVVVAAGLALSVASQPVGGWLAVAVAGVVLLVAAITRMGVLSGVSALLAWVGPLMVAEPALQEHTWLVLAAVAAVLALADVARQGVQQPWWARWDLSLFLAAHLVLLLGLPLVLESDQRAILGAGVGLLAFVVAARLRARPEWAIVYAIAGAGVLLLASVDAGPGWTALTLLAIAAALGVTAERVGTTQTRVALQVAATVAAGLGWWQGAVWLDLSTQQTVDVTAVGGGVLALAVAAAGRWRTSLRTWTLSVGAVTSLVVVSIALLSLLTELATSSAWVATGTGVLAIGWVVAAQSMRRTGLRAGATVLLVLTEVLALAAVSATPTTVVLALVATAVAASVLALVPVPAVDDWRTSVVALSSVSVVAAGLAALDELPETTLLVPVLLVGAGVAAASGVVLSSLWLKALAPPLACGAWLVFAIGALGDNPQWYTVPLGLALLVIVGLLRHDARQRGSDVAASGIVALEFVGITFLVAAAFVQAVVDSLLYVGLALVIGALVAVWGLLTRVRRRVVAGVAILLAAAVLLLAVPLVNLLPTWQGTALWIFLAGAGLVALLAATVIEKGRVVVRKAFDRYAAMGDEWE